MRVAKFSETTWFRLGLRGGIRDDDASLPEDQKPGARYWRLFKGTAGKPGNFEMCVLRNPLVDRDIHFPRHRHDFDQLRYTLTGNPAWGPGTAVPPGSMVYTPAGTYYGPYDRDGGEEQLHVQFEGANGAPFIDYDTLAKVRAELARKGTFERGTYTWFDESGRRHNVDGHQAAMEFITGQPMVYPEPRFSSSIQMDPQHFTWLDVEPGVQFKELGSFGERQTRIAMLGIDDGSIYRAESPEQTTLLFVTQGEGLADGTAIEPRDGMLLVKGDSGLLAARGSRLEILLLGLPKVDVAGASQASSFRTDFVNA